jgi:Rieske 2Fe-2S family protein
MQHSTQTQLIERVLSALSNPAEQSQNISRVPLQNYRDPAQLTKENELLFRSFPFIVAHQSELAAPGSCITHDHSGAPIVVVRDLTGTLRAFINLCRHRGARLVESSCSGKKAFTCRYHAWSYDLQGRLLHIPVEEAFSGVERESLRLAELPIFERFGFIWVSPTPNVQLEPFLHGVQQDLESFGLSQHRVFRASEGVRNTQWKLIIEAFLEGYHAKSLHQTSLARFFLDRGVIFDLFGPHVRSIGPRQSIKEIHKQPQDAWQIRRVTTPFYFLFPNTVLVFHPESVSHIEVFPAGLDRAFYRHSFLVDTPADDQEANARHEKTFALIDGVVFQQEDLMIAESIQRGLPFHPGPDFILGSLEYPIQHLHENISRAIQGERWGLSDRL